MASKMEEPMVAFLGPRASYTHHAALERFAQQNVKLCAQTTIEGVFSAVQVRRATYGIVPFENSSNGSVVFTLDLFANIQNDYPDVIVSGEIYLPVRHCLVGHCRPPTTQSLPSHLQDATASGGSSDNDSSSGYATPTQSSPLPAKPRASPRHDITHVRKLFSHPQAWGQCKVFLSAYLKGVERQDVSSTSRAAELVAQDSTGTSAAISSKVAAELNGLDVLAEGIEDSEGNSTRFFVLKRREAQNPPRGDGDAGEADRFKTLVSFTVEHGEPGALADCLAVFKKHRVNLTSINTRPSGETAWHYVFFVECLGRYNDNGESSAVNRTLHDLERVARSWRWLGSWEDAYSTSP